MSDERNKTATESPKTGEAPKAGDPDVSPGSAPGGDAADAAGDAAGDVSPSPKSEPSTTEKKEEEEEDDEAVPDVPGVGVVPAEPVHPKPSYVFLAVAALFALALDLGTKSWAVDHLGGAHSRRIVIIENFFHLDMAQNKGGAWGIFGDQPDYIRLPFFFLISAVAVVFVVSLYKRLEPRQVALKWALPLLLGGAAGNLIDRIRHQYVVDFLDVFIVRDGHPTHWPTFNVADIWIVVGVGLMAIDMFTPRKPVPAKRQKEAEAEA